jgi:hypothetical protein
MQASISAPARLFDSPSMRKIHRAAEDYGDALKQTFSEGIDIIVDYLWARQETADRRVNTRIAIGQFRLNAFSNHPDRSGESCPARRNLHPVKPELPGKDAASG